MPLGDWGEIITITLWLISSEYIVINSQAMSHMFHNSHCDTTLPYQAIVRIQVSFLNAIYFSQNNLNFLSPNFNWFPFV